CTARSRAQRRADESGKIHRRWHAVKKTELEMFDRSRRVLAALPLPCGERVGRGGWIYSETLALTPSPPYGMGSGPGSLGRYPLTFTVTGPTIRRPPLRHPRAWRLL